jgi:EpsD family peptidyl-prolyl cis-trans isomerase
MENAAMPKQPATGGTPRPRLRIAAVAFACMTTTVLVALSKVAIAQASGGQVIAHSASVNVTQQELDNELRLANVQASQRTDQTIKAALTQIIARKYMARQALAAKLDSEPTVDLDLLRSRELVLAGAYAQHELSTKSSSISKAEVDQYIEAHPDQFAKRLLFQIEQISFAPQKDANVISAAVKDFKLLDQVSAKLSELGIRFSRGSGTIDGATVPAELLRALRARRADDIFFLQSKASVNFLKVTSVEERPLFAEDANRFALQQLTADLTREIAQRAVDKPLASIKFEGDYSRVMSTPTPPANSQSPNEIEQKQPGETPPKD